MKEASNRSNVGFILKTSVSLLGVFVMLCFSSCEKDFMMEEPEGASKIVVNCLLSRNNGIRVHLSKSNFIPIEEQLQTMRDAQVELFENNIPVGMLPFVLHDSSDVFGFYQWDQLPVAGNRYSIKVTHPEYETVTALDTFPNQPHVNSCELIEYGDSADNLVGRLRLNLQSESDIVGYYAILFWQTGRAFTVNSAGDTTFREFEIKTPPLLRSTLSDTAALGYLYFSDRDFTGSAKDIHFEFKTISLERVQEAALRVELFQISRAHYEYDKTLHLYNITPNGSELPAVFSNIHNGYGIFMSQSLHLITIPLN